VERIESVDVFRVLAIISVIAIHSSPFRVDVIDSSEVYRYLDVLINQLSRFAVPFFFIISGYFWGLKVRKGDDPISSGLVMGKRISILFLVWCFIYLLPLNFGSISEYGVLGPIKVVYWNISNLINEPVPLLIEGTKVHLWFLVGLLFALSISALLIKNEQTKLLIILSVLLYMFGILAKAYSNTPIGLNIDFNTRNGPFFSCILFVTGYLLSGKLINEKWLYSGLMVFLLGTVLHFSEIYILWAFFETSPRQDYVIGTYFMGTGIAMMALSNHRMLKVKVDRKSVV